MKYSRKTSREVTSPTALSNVKMKMSRRLQPGTLSVNSARAITLNPAKELNRHPTVIRVRDKLSNEPWFPDNPRMTRVKGATISKIHSESSRGGNAPLQTDGNVNGSSHGFRRSPFGAKSRGVTYGTNERAAMKAVTTTSKSKSQQKRRGIMPYVKDRAADVIWEGVLELWVLTIPTIVGDLTESHT